MVRSNLLLAGLGDNGLGNTDGVTGSLELPQSEEEDPDEGGKGDPEGDTGVDSIRNGSLDRGEDGTTTDTHDDGTSGNLGVSTHVTGSQNEDDRVHDGLRCGNRLSALDRHIR